MIDYSIVINVEGGGQVEIPCRDKKDFEAKSKICEQVVPDGNWEKIHLKSNSEQQNYTGVKQ